MVLECDLLERIQEEYENDSALHEIIASLQRNPKFKKHYSWFQDIYSKKEKQDCNSSECSIVEWYIGVVARLRSGRPLWSWCFNIEGQEFILLEGVGQRSKLSTEFQSMSELQLWYICESRVTATTAYTWYMDRLPIYFWKSMILVVVDMLSKVAHFMALTHPYPAASVAQTFLYNVFKLQWVSTLNSEWQRLCVSRWLLARVF